jgi:hypothetical protein
MSKLDPMINLNIERAICSAASPTASTVAHVRTMYPVALDEIERQREHIATLERELERHRHGTTTEGDDVCPNELYAANCRAVVEAAKAWRSAHGTLAVDLLRGSLRDAVDALLADEAKSK